MSLAWASPFKLFIKMQKNKEVYPPPPSRLLWNSLEPNQAVRQLDPWEMENPRN